MDENERNKDIDRIVGKYKHHPRVTGIKRSNHPELFLVRGVLKICSKFTGEHPCQSVISIKLQSNFWDFKV